MDVQTLLGDLIKNHPLLLAFVASVGALRLTVKPVLVALHEFTKRTPTEKDDILLAKLEGSKLWQVFSFLLDTIGSIKLPGAPGPGSGGVGVEDKTSTG